jgi:saccharopine dehydrogenase-like NADP-dependent oxidoreductase
VAKALATSDEVYVMAKHTALLLGCGTIGVAVARLLVLGQAPRAGLLAPEALEPRPFLEVLERWGVRLYFRHETHTDRFL